MYIYVANNCRSLFDRDVSHMSQGDILLHVVDFSVHLLLLIDLLTSSYDDSGV